MASGRSFLDQQRPTVRGDEIAETPMTSATTPDVTKGAVSYTISGDSKMLLNHPNDAQRVLSNRIRSSNINANRYLRIEVACLKDTAV
jgi:hypothetical protein